MIANNSIYNVPGAVQRALHILTFKFTQTQ